jgi:antibiotic biosynthesis monooxygenase (ABM) superfamily enzyme
MIQSAIGQRPASSWKRKLAIGLPLFFLIKGLLWLIVPVLLIYLGLN